MSFVTVYVCSYLMGMAWNRNLCPAPFASKWNSGNRHGGVRDPETDRGLDHVFFAQDAVTYRGLDLGMCRRGGQEGERQSNRGVHEASDTYPHKPNCPSKKLWWARWEKATSG